MWKTVDTILLALLMIVSILYVIITSIFGSKSDAMSGGASQIRTTYRGKPGFDDFMSRLTLILGGVFLGLALAINVIQTRFPQQ